MRKYTVAGLLLIGAIVILAILAIPGQRPKWHWGWEKADLYYCIEKHLSCYEAEVLRNDRDNWTINFRNKKDYSLVYTLVEAHENTVFTRWNDCLYVAVFSQFSSGCKVIAVDLKTGEELWKSWLEGIGPTSHSKYFNYVNIDTDGRQLIVMGLEANGQYTEHLDINTGKTLANKKFHLDESVWEKPSTRPANR